MARVWWRVETWTNPRWDDGWKPRGYWRPKLRLVNRYGPPPWAVGFAWLRFRLIFWYRDRGAPTGLQETNEDAST